MRDWLLYSALAILFVAAATALAAVPPRPVELRDGILTVKGKPFYPLGTWSDGPTTPEELAQLGMNVHFMGIGPSPQGAANLAKVVDKFSSSGILVIPYFGFGGAGVTPWAKADLEAYLKPLGNSPGILAWYIGDDLSEVHLPGMSATADTVHANDKMHPIVADYIAKPDPQGRAVFRPYLDIMCQYGYPIPNVSIEDYGRFFDEQRLAVGDPLWTWVQAFMGAHAGNELLLGAEGPGPLPEPEQVRLLTYVALNRGVRGILFFAIQPFRTVLEIKAEIALLCREIRMLEPYLAGGKLSLDIPTSDPIVKASSFARPEGAAVALVVMGENYHRWVDEGVRENVSFTVRCRGEKPRAVLATLPEPVECRVEQLGPGKVRVTVPKLEMGGLVLVTPDAREIERVKREAARHAAQVAPLAVQGATAQFRKVAGTYWNLGSNLPDAEAVLGDAEQNLRAAYAALVNRHPRAAVAASRAVMLLCRTAIDRTMRVAESRRPLLNELERIYLKSFYSLPRIPGIVSALPDTSGYRFLRDFALIGPFPLEMTVESAEVVPPGFDRPYPPESESNFGATYDGMAGPVRWQFAHLGFDARLNLEQYLAPSRNAVAYAYAAVNAPREMETKIGLGSNDGAKVWVNGEPVFIHHIGRNAAPNQESFGVKLRAGKNAVLVKIENWGARWELYLSVQDPDKLLTFSAQ
jgi:hypothetical protein